jgi:hypothetical protein
LTVPVAIKASFYLLTNHTSRKSKKPRVTLPLPKTCSLHIDKNFTYLYQ